MDLTPQQPAVGFCPNCGATAQPGGAFCGNCGTKLVAPEPEQPAIEPVAQPAVEPVTQPVAAPVEQPEPEPVAQPVFEQPVAQPVTESMPAAEPAQPFAPQPAPAPQQPFGTQPAQPAQPQQPFGAQPAQPQQPFGTQPGTPQPDQPFGAPVPPMNFQQPNQPGGVGALVCGILAILFGLLFPIIGVILGIVAIVLAKKGGGKAKVARICGIAGIVVSALMFVFGLFVGMSALDELVDDYDSGSSSSISSSDTPSVSVDSKYDIDSDLYLDADSQKIVEDVAAMFEALENGDSTALQQIADIADQGFYSELDFHMDDCGYSPMDYAKGMTSGFEYEVVSVVLDESDKTGWIGVDVDAKDVFDMLDKFNENIDAFDESGRANSMSEAEIKAELGRLLSDAVAATPVTDDVNYAMIDVEYVDGEWVVDMDSWDFEIDYMFGLV